MGTILIIVLILLLIGALPSWPYSSGWGYYPSGGLGLILVIILVLALWVECDPSLVLRNCAASKVASRNSECP